MIDNAFLAKSFMILSSKYHFLSTDLPPKNIALSLKIKLFVSKYIAFSH